MTDRIEREFEGQEADFVEELSDEALERLPIVRLEQTRDQIGRRMIVKIRREVSHAQGT